MYRKAPAAILALALAGGVLVLMAPTAVAAPTCFGRKATIVGTNRDPRRQTELKGTPGNDVIVGRGGSDLVEAGGGDDLICTGGGDDYIKAGTGDDKVNGGDGIEDIWGASGHDRIWGGEGPAEGLRGGSGNDRLFGGSGTEDYLFGGPGADVMDGGSGSDFVMFQESPRGIQGDLGAGTFSGHGEDTVVSIENVYGSAYDDVLYGDDGPNTMAGGPGDDLVYGVGGDDRFRSGWGGTDLLDGGDGLNTANYYLSWDPVEADLATGEAVTSGSDTLIGITNLVGSKFDDSLTGDGQDNLIHGSLGDDVTDGGGGTDTAAFFDSFELNLDLAQGTAVDDRGSDTLQNFENVIGSPYADTLVGDDGPNSIWGGSGADSILGGAGDDMLVGDRGTDALVGGDGTDSCDGETETECESDIARRSRRASMDRWRNT